MRAMIFAFTLAGCAGAPIGGGSVPDSGDTAEPVEPVEVCTDVYQVEGPAQTDIGEELAGYRYCSTDESGTGAIDREAAVDCSTDPRSLFTACGETDDHVVCAVDADCGEGGMCAANRWGYSDCECLHPCVADADCGDAGACVCASTAERQDQGYVTVVSVHECVPAACRTGADCESGVCGVSFDLCGFEAEGLYCRTDADACRDDADCGQTDDRNVCRFLADEGRWGCYWLADCE